MRAVRFRVEGVLNSFKMPFFKKYHKSFFAPPKTSILGMLTNILGKHEEFYYQLFDKNIFVSVVIENIDGFAKDLWKYKNLADRNGSIIRRDKLFKAKYTIYIYTEDENLLLNFEHALKFPKAVPSFGLDDELINILDVRTVYLEQNLTSVIDSVFMQTDFINSFFDVIEEDSQNEILLNFGEVNLKFEVQFDENKKYKNRIAKNTTNQIEYVGCKVKIYGNSWTDGKYRIQLY